MKRITLLLSLMICTINVMAQNMNSHFKQLLTIKGTWTMDTKRGPLFESWALLNDSTLVGKSYKLMNNTDTILLEDVTIIKKGIDIFYIPIVQGENNGEAVTFKLIKTDHETFVFDNPDHDYPQRVIYQLPKNDAMHAWIEGMDKGIYRKSDFMYKKVK